MPRSAVAVLALAVSTASCSLAFVEGPPPVRERRGGFDCTTGSVLPIGDLTLSVLGLLTLVAVATAGSGAFGGSHTSHVVVGAGGLAVGGLAATSAGVGFARVSACQDAQAQAAAR